MSQQQHNSEDHEHEASRAPADDARPHLGRQLLTNAYIILVILSAIGATAGSLISTSVASKPVEQWSWPLFAVLLTASIGLDRTRTNLFGASRVSLSFVALYATGLLQRRRATGKKSPPDRAPILEATWRAVLDQLGDASELVIGGKSMGGRVASMIADDVAARGLVCLGYPFHPLGKPQQTRTSHLESIRTPTLILQGDRDPMGNRADVATYVLSSAIELQWLEDGEHSFVPRKRSGRTESQNLSDAATAVLTFLTQLPR